MQNVCVALAALCVTAACVYASPTLTAPVISVTPGANPVTCEPMGSAAQRNDPLDDRACPATATNVMPPSTTQKKMRKFSSLKASATRELVNKVFLPRTRESVALTLSEQGRQNTPEEVESVLQEISWRLSPRSSEKQSSTAATSDQRAIALAQTPLVQGWRRSYILAQPRSLNQKRLLSSMAPYFNRSQFNNFVLCGDAPPVSEYIYTEARRNAAEGGPGTAANPNARTRRRLGIDQNGQMDEDFAFAASFVLQFMQNEAHGKRTKRLSHGERVEMVRAELTTSKTRIKAEYHSTIEQRLSDTTSGELLIYPIANKHFDVLVDGLSGGKSVNLTALDCCYWRYCMVTFGRIAEYIDIVTAGRPNLQESLHTLASTVEKYITHEYPQHLYDTSACCMHSKTFAFGAQRSSAREADEGHTPDDESDGILEMRCRSCDQIFCLLQELDRATRTAVLKPAEESADYLLHYLHTQLFPEVLTYLGHIVRKTHCSLSATHIFATMDRNATVVMRLDYKMKTPSIVKSEAQVCFFGKRGISDLGISFTYFREGDALDEGEDRSTISYESEMMTEYFDCFCDDAKEDWEAIAQTIIPVVQTFRRDHPRFVEAAIVTDGAGPFSGTELALFLTTLGKRTGLFVDIHYVTEPGNGKSKLDAHFAIVMQWMTNLVANYQGAADINCAVDAAKTCSLDGGIANTRSFSVELMRQHSNSLPTTSTTPGQQNGLEAATVPVEAASSPKIKDIQLFSLRRYSYDDRREQAVSISMYEIPFWDEENPSLVLGDDELGLLVNRSAVLEVAPASMIEHYADRGVTAKARRQNATYKGIYTLHDREQARASHAHAEEARSMRAESEVAARNAALEKARTSSNLLYCTVSGCKWACLQPHSMRKHLQVGVHTLDQKTLRYPRSAVYELLPQDTDTDMILRHCSHIGENVTMGSTLDSRLMAKRPDTYLEPASYLAEEETADGGEIELNQFQIQEGFALHHDTKDMRLTASMLEFLIYCQGRGDPAVDNGAKSLPVQCERAMRLKGTEAGAEIFRATAKDRLIMAPNETNSREFSLDQVLNINQIKTYLCKSHKDLQSQLTRLQAKQEAERRRQEDPLYAAIKVLQRSTLLTRFKKLQKNHSADQNPTSAGNMALSRFSAASVSAPATPLDQLRQLLQDIVHAYGNTNEDVHLFL